MKEGGGYFKTRGGCYDLGRIPTHLHSVSILTMMTGIVLVWYKKE